MQSARERLIAEPVVYRGYALRISEKENDIVLQQCSASLSWCATSLLQDVIKKSKGLAVVGQYTDVSIATVNPT